LLVKRGRWGNHGKGAGKRNDQTKKNTGGKRKERRKEANNVPKNGIAQRSIRKDSV